MDGIGSEGHNSSNNNYNNNSSSSNVWKVPEIGILKKEELMLEGKEGWKMGQREASVLRYKEKRQSRLFSKRIRYEVRKLNAEKRPRMKVLHNSTPSHFITIFILLFLFYLSFFFISLFHPIYVCVYMLKPW